jgi:enoyl-CoA hydratase/carnithine racemase
MTEAPHLLVTEEDGVLIATLNRPEKLNALSNQLMASFVEAVERFRDTPSLKVMLIRATGRYFSAGADLMEGSSRPAPTTGSGIREMHRLHMRDMQRIYDEMEAIEKPFVAAHQGTCVGGGLEMSLSCDFRLAAKRARYSFPEGKFGVLPASNGVSRLVRVVGTAWARYLVMANMIADAQEALTMGLVHKVFPDETFEDDVMAFCRHLAKQHGEQMGTAKLAIEMARDVGLAQARNVERMANSVLMLMPDYQAGMERHRQNVGKGKGE